MIIVTVVLFVASLYFAYSNLKSLFAPFEAYAKDIKYNIDYCEQHGTIAIWVGVIISLLIGLVYIYLINHVGLIPIKILYGILIFQLISLMFEHFATIGIINNGKKLWIFDKVQRFINSGLAIWVIVLTFGAI